MRNRLPYIFALGAAVAIMARPGITLAAPHIHTANLTWDLAWTAAYVIGVIALWKWPTRH